jgi:hypothetical protein
MSVENTRLALAGGCFFIPYKFVRQGRANAALFDSGTRGGELGQSGFWRIDLGASTNLVAPAVCHYLGKLASLQMDLRN